MVPARQNVVMIKDRWRELFLTNPRFLCPWHEPERGVQFSFRVKRYCSAGTTAYTSAFNGISFPGSAIGNVTYFSLSPSYVILVPRISHASWGVASNSPKKRGLFLFHPVVLGRRNLQASVHGGDLRPERFVLGRWLRLQSWFRRKWLLVHPYAADGKLIVSVPPQIYVTKRSSSRLPGMPPLQNATARVCARPTSPARVDPRAARPAIPATFTTTAPALVRATCP